VTPLHPAPDLPRIPGYELEGELGRGGMGCVYAARRLSDGLAVAIKVVRTTGTGSGEQAMARRLRREAAVGRQLHHPNIVELFDEGATDAGPYLVMERLHGVSLARHEHFGRLPVDVTMTVLDHVLAAFTYFHPQGLVHRDIKPSNVFLTRDGRVVLLDFGLVHARDMTRITATLEAAGSVGTMAPEQLTGGHLGPDTDVYQLGATVYRALTGRYPYTPSDVVGYVTNGTVVEPPPLEKDRPDVPIELVAAITQCLPFDRARRLRDGHAVRRRLRQEGAVVLLPPRPPLPPPPPSGRKRRRRLLLTVVAAIVVAALLAGLAASWMYRRSMAAVARRRSAAREVPRLRRALVDSERPTEAALTELACKLDEAGLPLGLPEDLAALPATERAALYCARSCVAGREFLPAARLHAALLELRRTRRADDGAGSTEARVLASERVTCAMAIVAEVADRWRRRSAERSLLLLSPALELCRSSLAALEDTDRWSEVVGLYFSLLGTIGTDETKREFVAFVERAAVESRRSAFGRVELPRRAAEMLAFAWSSAAEDLDRAERWLSAAVELTDDEAKAVLLNGLAVILAKSDPKTARLDERVERGLELARDAERTARTAATRHLALTSQVWIMQRLGRSAEAWRLADTLRPDEVPVDRRWFCWRVLGDLCYEKELSDRAIHYHRRARDEGPPEYILYHGSLVTRSEVGTTGLRYFLPR